MSTSVKVKQINIVFCLTLFLSAVLMFSVQPMVGKMLLPMVGGAPSGWLVALAFFQFSILIGYALAHFLSFISVRYHLSIVLLLLLLGLLFLPLHIVQLSIDQSEIPESTSVLFALITALAIPFIGLSTLSPSLQRLFEMCSGQSPYFLFAASNVGSFLGLLAYPLWIERVFGLKAQTLIWQVGYSLLIVTVCICMMLGQKLTKTLKGKVRQKELATTWTRKAQWIFLSFVPSSLMIGVTAYTTLDNVWLPLMYIVPLALYLLTFVWAFSHDRTSLPNWLLYAQPMSVLAIALLFIIQPFSIGTGLFYTIFPLIAFFLTALICHFKLISLRPLSQNVTGFYVWIALGGALGGLFNVFVAPLIFSLPIEFMVVALLSCFVHPILFGSKIEKRKKILYVGGMAVVILLCVVAPVFQAASPLVIKRNFYGVSRIYDYGDANSTYRVLYNGSQIHSLQQIKPHFAVAPISYFGAKSPVGEVMALPNMQKIAMIGFGAGTVLCYKEAGREFTAYEINPAVVYLAQNWFEYIKNCGEPRFHMGDARKQLEQGVDAQYDVMVFNVFSSDILPLHLLTKEAFQTYLNRLAPKGVIVLHIYSQSYDLMPPLSAVAQSLGLQGLSKTYKPLNDKERYLWGHIPVIPAPWVAFTLDETVINKLRSQGWQDLPPPKAVPWTDDFTDSFSALKWPEFLKEEGSDAQTY
ncbi:MAG: fused MFS/spermidine synthase [Alphaproteobacteria bacterium]